MTVLHLYGSQAPYYFEDDRAVFTPFGRVVAWSKMTELHNAYRNAIVEQDLVSLASAPSSATSNDDPRCAEFLVASRRHFERLPNRRPNR